MAHRWRTGTARTAGTGMADGMVRTLRRSVAPDGQADLAHGEARLGPPGAAGERRRGAPVAHRQAAPRPTAGTRWGVIGDGPSGSPEVHQVHAQAVALAEELERDLIERGRALQARIGALIRQEAPARADSARGLGTP